MVDNQRIPIKETLFKRPRLEQLFEHGMEYPLLTVLAAPGYAKTQETAASLADKDVRVMWLRLTRLDNLSSCFWSDLVKSLECENPQFAKKIESLQFPETLIGFDVFFRALAGSVYFDKQVVWIIDDFEVLNNPQILNFFQMLIGAELENFCLVLISNEKSVIAQMEVLTNNRFTITGENLRFTKEETESFFKANQIGLQPDELKEIEQYTEGWPLALHLIMMQLKEKKDHNIMKAQDISLNAINALFNARFFADYPQAIRKLLVMMSELEWFTLEMVIELYEETDKTTLRQLENNTFITYVPYKKIYYFHNLYRSFLQDNVYIINDADKMRLHQTAAGYFAAGGHLIKAISCYRQCNNYGCMLECIAEFFRTTNSITQEHARYFMEQLDLLSAEQRKQYPLADYLRVRALISTLQLDQAEQLMADLEQRLSGSKHSEDCLLLGEVYAMMGAVHMMRNQEDFGYYYQKACELLPEGTRLRHNDTLMIENNHNFSMADNQPGAKERMEKAVHFGVPLMARVFNGGMYGMEYLYSAEAAFLSYQIEDARQYAYRAIYKAQQKGQHDLACNAHCILARSALVQGDYAELDKEIKTITEYAARYDIVALKEIRDTALAWFYIKMEDTARVPRSLLTMMEREVAMIANNRGQIVYASYLVLNGEYRKAIAFLEHTCGLYLAQGIWPDRIGVLLILAVSYQSVGDMERALEALWQAYDMTYHNNLTTLFIAGGKYMRRLLQAARKQSKYSFDPKWLDLINSRAITYTKKLLAVQNSYYKEKKGAEKTKYYLSKREKEVLQSLSQGLTREEIADFHSISINTVKSVITNIYNKLGAVNRADAVYIAATEGFLD